MSECTRGGLCNFMHLKPVSKHLKRELYEAQRLSIQMLNPRPEEAAREARMKLTRSVEKREPAPERNDRRVDRRVDRRDDRRDDRRRDDRRDDRSRDDRRDYRPRDERSRDDRRDYRSSSDRYRDDRRRDYDREYDRHRR